MNYSKGIDNVQVAEVIELNIDGETFAVERLYDGTFRKPAYLAGAEREVVGESMRHGGGHRNAYDYGNGKQTMGNAIVPPITAPATPEAATWQGYGTALKPAWEPVILAMKPLDGTFANNALTWGVAGLNIDGARVPTGESWSFGERQFAGKRGGIMGETVPRKPSQSNPAGRFPANLILDEDAAAALDAMTIEAGARCARGDSGGFEVGEFQGWEKRPSEHRKAIGYGDGVPGASRFFYVAKASRAERNAGLEGMEARSNAERDGRNQYKNGAARNGSGNLVNGDGHILPQQNHHPTVKPLALMRYLVRLTATPTGGIVLDPFMGSGTTGVACMMEGRSFIGIDKEPEYVEIARRRIATVQPALMGADQWQR
jgi:site-specific DNA-methyltransferase (adenine-specific)